jgi:hypothetical protein
LPKQPRPRYRRKYGAWLLPIAALVLGWYVWTRPATQTGRAGAYDRNAAASGLQPESADLQGGAQAVIQAARNATSSDSPAAATRPPRSGAGKGRRANPGQAPPHMRDVVF